MAYIPWYDRLKPATLGERFGLNEISTRAKPLSPTKSYASKLGTEYEDIITIDDYDRWYKNTKILEDFDVSKATMHKDGGRIDMKPGGIVEPGVTHYARTAAEIKADAFRTGVPRKKLSDWTPQQRANLKTWMKNTGSTLEDFNKKTNSEKFAIKRGHNLGILQANEPKKLANIKAWEKNTGKKFEDVKKPDKKWRIRGGVTTGLGESKFTEAEQAANIKAWEKNTGKKFEDIESKEIQSSIRRGQTKGNMATRAAAESLEKAVWLKNHTPDDLIKDLKAGKTKNQIAEELYTNNPEYFDNLQKTRKIKEPNVLNHIKTAVGGRIGKNQDLIRLNKLNEKNLLAKEKIALKDVKNFIKKNQEAYKKVYASNKIGAVSNFREKVLDFISKKYPDFIKRSKGGKNILSGQRVFTPYRLTERSGQGQYSLDVGLKKDIRKALDIPERPLAGQGMTIPRLQRNYNKNLLSLIKVARDKNIIPKSINSESKYVSYIKKTQSDPIRNLFGKKFNFGQEHLGGVSRAVTVNDAQSLAKITAIDPVVNQWVKGPQYDKKISSLMKLAKQSSGETAKGYIDSVNKLLAESDAKFGLNQTKYKIVKDEIIPIQPKGALEDSLYKKAQRALKTFVATKRFKDPKFKLLPEELKKAINFLKEGDVLKSNAFLKNAIKRGGAASVILLGTGIALNTLTDSAEAQTLETSDKTQESNLAGNLTAVTAAGTIAAKYPKEILEGGKKVLTKTGSGFEKIIRPLFIPAVDALLATTDTPLTDKKHHRDVTSTHFWLSKAFWANAMDKYGITRTVSMLKDTPDFKGKAKIARDIFLRAGINPAAVRFISSKVAWPATAAAAVYDSYKDYQRRKPHIEKVKELRKQGIVKEEEFDEKMPMFESGGIASLLK